MKPGKPLERRTALARGCGPARSSGLKRGKALAPVSPKPEKVAARRDRAEFRDAVLLERPACEACVVVYCNTRGLHGSPRPRCSVDVHERIRRGQGGDVLDRENAIATCRPCHDWIHAHPERARALELLARGVHLVRKIYRRATLGG